MLVLALGVAVLAISFAAVLFRLAPDLDPRVAAGWRLVIAGLVTLPLTLRHRPPLGAWAAASLAYGVHFGAWVASLGLMTVALSVTAVTTTPLLLAVVGLVTGRDRPSGRVLASLGLGVLGLVVMALAPGSGADTAHPRGDDPALGLALALLGAAAMGAYLLVARRSALRKPLHPLAFSGSSALGGGLLLLLAAALTGAPIWPATADEAWVVLGAAALPQLVGHTLLTWAVRHTSPTQVALATLGEPVGAALLAVVILAEPVSALGAVGALLTLGAVALALSGPARPSDDAVDGAAGDATRDTTAP